jgi:hypothetical protein
MKTRQCIAWDVDYLERIAPTLPLTDRQRKEVTEAITEARARGLSAIPPCDNHDERGVCAGHVIIEENERP